MSQYDKSLDAQSPVEAGTSSSNLLARNTHLTLNVQWRSFSLQEKKDGARLRGSHPVLPCLELLPGDLEDKSFSEPLCVVSNVEYMKFAVWFHENPATFWMIELLVHLVKTSFRPEAGIWRLHGLLL